MRDKFQSPWVRFIPLLFLYLAIIYFKGGLTVPLGYNGDETRYYNYAENLTHGYYTWPHYPMLWNGPGYPLFLFPFLLLKIPLWVARFANAFMVYAAVVLIWKTLIRYCSPRKALLFSLAAGLYYPLLDFHLVTLLTECLSFLLVSAIMYHLSRAFSGPESPGWRNKDLLFAGFFTGYLALTRVIFGPVLMVMLPLCLLAWGFAGSSWKSAAAGLSRVTLLAFLVCIPWLAYTYKYSHRLFFWSDSGASTFYWMSSPYPDELGDWHLVSEYEHPDLIAHHQAFFDSIAPLGPYERYDALMAKAKENILRHPGKYAYNWIANTGRLFFSYPLSHLQPSNGIFYYLLPHAPLLVFSVLCLFPLILFRRDYPPEILWLAAFLFLYLGLSTLFSAYVRFFFIIVPVPLLIIAVTLQRFVRFGRRAKAAADLHGQPGA